MVHRVMPNVRRRAPALPLREGNAWVLPVPPMRQTMAKSCGLAACSMIIGYRTGTMPGDRELAGRHRIDCSDGMSADEIKRVLTAEIGAQFSAVHRATRQTLLAALQAGDPVLAGVAVKGGAHAIVVSGIVVLEGGGTRLVINDPNFGGVALFCAADAVDAALQMAMVVRCA